MSEKLTRAFKGIWIPKEIWLSEDLNIIEKVFIVEIDSLNNEEGCFASNDYFAKFFNLSKNRCSEIIKGLEKKGYISITYKYKENSKCIEKRIIKTNNRIYNRGNGGIRDSDRGIRDSDGGYSENKEDNNIGFNNPSNNLYIEQMDQLWKAYPNKKGKDAAYKKIPKLLKKYSFDELMRCIERYAKETQGKDKQYIKQGSTFFNSGYVDYLDENYEETTQSSNNSMNQNKNNIPQYRTGAGANVNNAFRNYSPEELERYLREMQKGKGM